MEPSDAAWLHTDLPTNRMIVNSVTWFDEPLDRNAVRVLLQERLILRFLHFSQRIVEQPRLRLVEGRRGSRDRAASDSGHAAWTGWTARAPALREPCPAQDVRAEHPLWEMHLIDGYHGHGSAILARIHHSIADGIALSRVMMSLTDDPKDAADSGVFDAVAPVHVSLLPSLIHRTERWLVTIGP